MASSKRKSSGTDENKEAAAKKKPTSTPSSSSPARRPRLTTSNASILSTLPHTMTIGDLHPYPHLQNYVLEAANQEKNAQYPAEEIPAHLVQTDSGLYNNTQSQPERDEDTDVFPQVTDEKKDAPAVPLVSAAPQQSNDSLPQSEDDIAPAQPLKLTRTLASPSQFFEDATESTPPLKLTRSLASTASHFNEFLIDRAMNKFK